MEETIAFQAVLIGQSFSKTFYEHIYYSCFWSCTLSELYFIWSLFCKSTWWV